MSPVVPSVAAESAPSRRRPWLRRLEYVGRVVVAGFVLWICWSVATTFSLLVRDDAPQRPTTGTKAEAEVAPFDWVRAIAAGRGWSFEQTGWSVQLHTIADAEIAGELSRRLTDPATFGPMLDTERSILDVLNQMPNVAAERDGGVDHAYESPAFRYVVRTRTVENVRRVAWARGAVRRNDLEWTVLEARPSNASSAIESLGVLLPSPPATKRIAARLDRHGAIACEFLRSPGRLADLVDYWRAHDVATTPSSTGSQGVQELQCRFQGRSFQVAALSESQTLGTTLMIVALDPPSVTSSSALPSAP